jgi:hypothetical protein
MRKSCGRKVLSDLKSCSKRREAGEQSDKAFPLKEHATDFGLFHAQCLDPGPKDRLDISLLRGLRNYDDDMPSFGHITQTDLEAVQADAIRILSGTFPDLDTMTISSAIQDVFNTLDIEKESESASPAPTSSTAPRSPTPACLAPNPLQCHHIEGTTHFDPVNSYRNMRRFCRGETERVNVHFIVISIRCSCSVYQY